MDPATLRSETDAELRLRIDSLNGIINVAKVQKRSNNTQREATENPELKKQFSECITTLQEEIDTRTLMITEIQEELDRRKPRYKDQQVKVPDPPGSLESMSKRPFINAAECTALFANKKSSMWTRLTLLARYAKQQQWDHTTIKLSLNWVLSEQEKVSYALVENKPIQEVFDALIQMHPEKQKDREYYERELQKFTRPVGMPLEGALKHIKYTCDKAVEDRAWSQDNGLKLRYIEMAIQNLTTAATMKLVKKFIKEKERKSQTYTEDELAEEACRIEQVEGNEPTCEMSMKGADIKTVLAASRNREVSPETIRKRSRERYQAQRKLERAESRDRRRRMLDGEYEMDKPIIEETRPTTPRPEEEREYAEYRPRSQSRGRPRSKDQERQGSYNRDASRERYRYGRGRSGSRDRYDQARRRRSQSRGRYDRRSSSPINEFLSATVQQLFLGGDSRYVLRPICRKCDRKQPDCKCYTQ